MLVKKERHGQIETAGGHEIKTDSKVEPESLILRNINFNHQSHNMIIIMDLNKQANKKW